MRIYFWLIFLKFVALNKYRCKTLSFGAIANYSRFFRPPRACTRERQLTFSAELAKLPRGCERPQPQDCSRTLSTTLVTVSSKLLLVPFKSLFIPPNDLLKSFLFNLQFDRDLKLHRPEVWFSQAGFYELHNALPLIDSRNPNLSQLVFCMCSADLRITTLQ
jgi:hypothetical protein